MFEDSKYCINVKKKHLNTEHVMTKKDDEDWRVLHIFQKVFCSTEDHRGKYVVVQ